MKVIKPWGRNDNSNRPLACMCHGTSQFQSARGSDGCTVCGCHCGDDTTVTKGNSSTARWTVRRSEEP